MEETYGIEREDFVSAELEIVPGRKSKRLAVLTEA